MGNPSKIRMMTRVPLWLRKPQNVDWFVSRRPWLSDSKSSRGSRGPMGLDVDLEVCQRSVAMTPEILARFFPVALPRIGV